MRESQQAASPPIQCTDVTEQLLADHYVLGQLLPEEAEAFEDHYMSCDSCCAEVERAELMAKGFKKIAAKDLSDQPERQPEKSQESSTVSQLADHDPRKRRKVSQRRFNGLLAAALAGAVVSLPIWVHRFESSTADNPQISVFHLQPLRSSSTQVDQRLQLAQHPVVLALELSPPFYEKYRARLLRNGNEMWEAGDLQLGERETVHIKLSNELLTSGDYNLILEGKNSSGSWFDASLFAFKVAE